ncbi:hypothetical protein ACSV4D_06185 [Flavobacterium sp. ARAG 55.4]|uniref:hypothetical protein n=1 Tax=Flavobacterium sp. ARAG 55.4 TaxID=3451357 RepID=UPI003F44F476
MELKDIIIAIIIIMVALSAGLLSAYQYIDSTKKEKENEKTTQQLIKAQQKINNINHQISNAQQTSLNLSKELKIAQQKSLEKSEELINAQFKINHLQSEMINQVLGKGYPRLKLMNAQGSNFKIYLEPSTNYPIFKVSIKLSDSKKLLNCQFSNYPDKIVVNKSCYDDSLLLQSYHPLDLIGNQITFIDSEIPKKNYYLMTEFICKNIIVVQYSIIKYDKQNLHHDYRIYEISKSDSSFSRLLENTNKEITDEVYKENFLLEKTIIIDSSK